jgi:phage regulator Rha-like protein
MKKINNDLVSLTTQDVGKAIPITNTLIVAKKLGIEHKSVIQLVRKYKSDFEEFGQVTFEMRLIKHKLRNQKTEIALLNESQFMVLITYSKNTENARYWKRQFVKQFMNMRIELMVRKETRHIGINVRKTMTDSIKLNVDENTNFKKFAYSNYSKLVYKKVLGKTVKKAKEEIGLTTKDNIRNHFSVEELERVQKIESKIATWIEAWKDLEMTDKEVYAKIKEKIDTIK